MTTAGTECDAVVIGAGFAGLGAAHHLREQGLAVRGFETADGVGGTWYWNRYPGARTDSKAFIYCYTFSEEIRAGWDWSELYPTQPEVLAYLEFVAARLDLGPLFRFGTTVTRLVWDDADGVWTVHTDRGDTVRTRYVVTGVGILSAVNLPAIEGLGSFAGPVVHTSRWPHEGVDVTGKRVALIGAGSSGVQILPELAAAAASVTLFQRTPNYVSPGVSPSLTDDDRRRFREEHDKIQAQVRANPLFQAYDLAGMSAKAAPAEERRTVYEQAWSEGGLALYMATYADLGVDAESNDTVAEFVREKIRDAVRDPETAAKLTPRGYPYGVKRPPSSAGFYETFNLDTVDVVDLRETPIERVTPTGAVVDGSERPYDVIVLATGFDAITGALTRIDVRGVGGRTLADEWRDGPLNYLGVAVPGFPNLFSLVGPMVPAGNVPSTAEHNAQWVAALIGHADAAGAGRVEVRAEAAERWRDTVLELWSHTLVYEAGGRANSWFMGSNIPGKAVRPLFYFGPAIDYVNACDAEAADGYPHFDLT